MSKILQIFLKKIPLKNINLGATFCFLLILCSIKIERLLFLKFLKILAFFDSYFWPFNKTHEKIIAIFVISAIIASIWNVFIKFRWHDEKLTVVRPLCYLMQIYFVTSLTGSAVKARVVLGSQSIGTLLCVEKKMVMWAFFFLAGYIYTTKIISISKGHSVSNTKTGFL